MTDYNLFDFDLEGLREVMAQSYNLWDFDLEKYREMITQTDIEGGFMDWPEHSHQVQEDD